MELRTIMNQMEDYHLTELMLKLLQTDLIDSHKFSGNSQIFLLVFYFVGNKIK